eukprot:9045_1
MGSVNGLDQPVVPQRMPQLCVDSNYVCQSNVLLKIKSQHLLSDVRRIIRDERTQVDILKVEQKLFQFAWKTKSYIVAMNGAKLACLQTETHFFKYPTYNMINVYGQLIATISGGCREWISYGIDKQTFYVHGIDNRILYVIVGRFYNMEFVIRNSVGEIVAKTSRKLVKTGLFSRSYGLNIARGNDVIVMMCIMTAMGKYKQLEESRSGSGVRT